MSKVAGQAITLETVVTRIEELVEDLSHLEGRLSHLEARMENLDVALFQDRRRSQEKARELEVGLSKLVNKVDNAQSHEDQLFRSQLGKQLVVINQLLDRAWGVIANAGDWYDTPKQTFNEWRRAAIAWRDDYHEYLQRVTAVEETTDFRPPTDDDYDSIEDWDR